MFPVTNYKLQKQNVILGILDTNQKILNYLISVGKFHLWNCRKKKILPTLSSFKQLIERKYYTEHFIAVKNHSEKRFELKWSIGTKNVNATKSRGDVT